MDNDKKIIKVYVAGAYSADNVLQVLENIGVGVRTAADLFRKGFAPYCPFLDHQYFITGTMTSCTVPDFYRATMAFLEVCDALLVVQNPTNCNSKGLDAEVIRANELGIKVFYSTEGLVGYYQHKRREF